MVKRNSEFLILEINGSNTQGFQYSGRPAAFFGAMEFVRRLHRRCQSDVTLWGCDARERMRDSRVANSPFSARKQTFTAVAGGIALSEAKRYSNTGSGHGIDPRGRRNDEFNR